MPQPDRRSGSVESALRRTLTARWLKTLAEPTRLHLLEELRTGKATVQELTRAVDLSEPNVSRHLNRLHLAGILLRERQGIHVRYAVADPRVYAVCDEVSASLGRHFGQLSQVVDS